MDVTFRDDQCRIRTDHAPANFTTIKHMALNQIRRARGKDSLRLRRKVAAWDDDFLASLIAAQLFHPIPLTLSVGQWPNRSRIWVTKAEWLSVSTVELVEGGKV
jgi:hypothetical protein